MWPPYKVSSNEEEPILPTTTVGPEASDDWCTTNSGDHLVSPLVFIMLLQVIREEDLSYLALDPMPNTQTFQGN